MSEEELASPENIQKHLAAATIAKSICHIFIPNWILFFFFFFCFEILDFFQIFLFLFLYHKNSVFISIDCVTKVHWKQLQMLV